MAIQATFVVEQLQNAYQLFIAEELEAFAGVANMQA
jgi:hypothetical protein